MDPAPDPAPDHPPSLVSHEEIMFFDTDAGGVVHNIAYLRFIETCRTRLGALLGLDLRSMAQRQQFAVVLRTEIDYRRPALLGDHIVVRGRLDRLERVRFHCAFEIHRPADQSHLVSCRQSLALVQLPHARPIRLPEHWRSQWPHLESSSQPTRSSPR